MVMNLSPTQQSVENAAWMATFNYVLAQTLTGLDALNPNVDFYLLDMINFTPSIDNTDGTWLADCAANPAACSGETYAWWDRVGVHPTTEIHKQIGRYAANMVPEPASIILLILGFAGLIGARRMK